MDNFTITPETVKFSLFLKYNRSGIELDKTNLRSMKFNSSLETVFLVHGWRSNPSTSTFHRIKDAYLKTRHINVILVDWGEIASNEYLSAKLSVIRVAKAIVKIIRKMMKSVALHLRKVSFVGHSLGAHIAAVSSRLVGGRVQHITGELKIISTEQ